MNKKLALIITKSEYAGKIISIIEAAAKKGVEVSVFIMDEGVRVTLNEKFVSFAKQNNLKISLCEHSCNINKVSLRVEGFNYGSQFSNAKIISGLEEGDKILVF